MKIDNSFLMQANFVLKESVSNLTEQQKKIIIIASFVFALLAACYVGYAMRGWAHAKEEELLLTGPGNKIIYSDGKIEEGDFSKGLLNGRGKRTLPGGRIEEGDFSKGQLNGQGKLVKKTWKGKEVWEGEFQNGSLNGSGKYQVSLQGNVIESYEGNFELGYFDGQGKYLDKNGIVKEGMFWVNHLKKGKQTLPNGIIEEGDFNPSTGHLIKGKKFSANGAVLEEGEFMDDQIVNGKGKKAFPDGTIHEGKFKKGLLDGQGQVTYPDGKIKKGNFKNGVFQA